MAPANTSPRLAAIAHVASPANPKMVSCRACGSAGGASAKPGGGQAAYWRVTVQPRASSWWMWLRLLRSGSIRVA